MFYKERQLIFTLLTLYLWTANFIYEWGYVTTPCLSPYRERICSFTIKYDVNCNFFVIVLYQIEEAPSISSFIRDVCFYQQWILYSFLSASNKKSYSFSPLSGKLHWLILDFESTLSSWDKNKLSLCTVLFPITEFFGWYFIVFTNMPIKNCL